MVEHFTFRVFVFSNFRNSVARYCRFHLTCVLSIAGFILDFSFCFWFFYGLGTPVRVNYLIVTVIFGVFFIGDTRRAFLLKVCLQYSCI